MLLCLVLTIPYPWWGRTVVFSLVKFWDLRKASCSSVVSPPPVAVISRRGEAGCGSIRQPGVYGVAVSSDGDYILSGSLDGSARLWRVGERLSRVRQRALPCADVVAMSCKSGVVVCLCECGVDLCHHTGAECMC